MNIIDEYKDVMERIAVVKSKLTTAKRELDKEINACRPGDIQGIRYDKEKIQSSYQQKEALETLTNIHIWDRHIKLLQGELNGLYDQRRDLERAVDEMGDIKKAYLMYKLKDPRTPNWKIAQKVHVSPRTLNNYIRQIKDAEKEKFA